METFRYAKRPDEVIVACLTPENHREIVEWIGGDARYEPYSATDPTMVVRWGDSVSGRVGVAFPGWVVIGHVWPRDDGSETVSWFETYSKLEELHARWAPTWVEIPR